MIKKAAEIIPKVICVTEHATNKLTPFEPPEFCPSCGARLVPVEGEVNLYCPNTRGCPEQIKAKIEYWVSKDCMDMEGIGGNLVSQLVDTGMVSTPADLYKLTIDGLMRLNLIADKSAQNIYNVIQNSKNPTLARFINALGIRHVGKEMSELLANTFLSLDALKKATYEDLIAIDGCGEKIAVSVLDFFSDSYNNVILNQLQACGVIPAQVEDNRVSQILEGMTFVITGTLSDTRDKFSAMIKAHGGKTSSSVSKNTSYVLAGDNPGSKYDKAVTLGVKILNENEFKKMIGD